MNSIDPYGVWEDYLREDYLRSPQRAEPQSAWQKIKDAVGGVLLPKPLPELPPLHLLRPPATPAGQLKRISDRLCKLVTRTHDKKLVVDSENWRELWDINPRKADDYDLIVLEFCCVLQFVRDATKALNSITSRGHLVAQEAEIIRRIYDQMLHPTPPANMSTRQEAIRQAKKRWVVMHQDKWRHSPARDGVDISRWYWNLAETFVNLFKHPVVGPAVFGESTASNEMRGLCAPPELKSGHSDGQWAPGTEVPAKSEPAVAGQGEGQKKRTGWLSAAVGGLAFLASAMHGAAAYLGCLLAFGFNYVLGRT